MLEIAMTPDEAAFVADAITNVVRVTGTWLVDPATFAKERGT